MSKPINLRNLEQSTIDAIDRFVAEHRYIKSKTKAVVNMIDSHEYLVEHIRSLKAQLAECRAMLKEAQMDADAAEVFFERFIDRAIKKHEKVSTTKSDIQKLKESLEQRELDAIPQGYDPYKDPNQLRIE